MEKRKSRVTQTMKKIFANYVFDKGFVSKVLYILTIQ